MPEPRPTFPLRRYGAPIWFVLARPHRLAYLQVPKVACTSFRVALCLLSRPDLPRDAVRQPGAIHQHRDWNDLVPPTFSGLRKYFRFTFVRHPLERFASFYRNKIADVSPELLAPRFARAGLTAGMPIEAVVERVLATPAAELDPHIVPQSHLVFDEDGAPRVDFIGRLERVAEDLAEVERRAGVHLDLDHLNTTRREPAETVPASVREQLITLYSDDFALLGYEP